jgi:uncharacterized integral membrane protein
MRFLSSFLVVVLTPLLILFAVFNSSDALLTWSPIHQPVNLPLYILVLAPLALGFVLGLLMGWISGSRIRGRSRRQRREIKKLEKELAGLKPEDKDHKGMDDFYPALPKKKDAL